MATIGMYSGYNEHGIRLTTVFPHPEGGWAVANRLKNPWAASHHQELRQFSSVDEAQRDVEQRHPTTPIEWRLEQVAQ